ncbi:hypothetical protein [Agrobacterium tumefaciens]|uniref:hypothetical protein n=1 Tax=Agrobacterium tumefaciens TaxID=358 RepID=UPI00157436C7|nr:hypothetical protein [Agrobacterium tumefaciens]
MKQAPVEITRARLEAKIEELVALLDLVDGDCDLEGNGDDEPSLGTGGRLGRDGVEDDLEDDTSDSEHSMGWANPRFGESPLPAGWSMGDWEQ